MADTTEEKKIISPYLSPEAYLILKQRAGRNKMTFTECLSYLVNECEFVSHEIATHDISHLLYELDERVNRASGYYNAMVSAGEISLDLGDRIIRLYANIDAILSSYNKELISVRDKENQAEEDTLEKLYRSAKKNLTRDRTVTSEKSADQHLKCWVTLKTYETLAEKMELAGYDREDKSKYFTDLIRAKCFLQISCYTDDLSRMNQLIYTATKPCPTFLRMFELQGFECAEQGREVSGHFANILRLQKGIWYTVMNDRKSLYQKYDKKLRIPEKEKKTRERRRTYKERS